MARAAAAASQVANAAVLANAHRAAAKLERGLLIHFVKEFKLKLNKKILFHACRNNFLMHDHMYDDTKCLYVFVGENHFGRPSAINLCMLSTVHDVLPSAHIV